MTGRRRLFLATMMLSLVTPATPFGSSKVPATCPVTLPADPAFLPPDPFPRKAPFNGSWHGTPELWTVMSRDGVFRGLKVRSPGKATLTRDKSFWWRPGFHPVRTPSPPLKIEGRRLDVDAPTLAQPWVTNAHDDGLGGWTMLTMLELTAGCWELTGTYNLDSVRFVVWVEEE